jgi:hypothetical protein
MNLLAIDSKWRGCDLVGLRVHDVIQESSESVRLLRFEAGPSYPRKQHPAKDQIPGMPTKPGKALTRSIQLRTLA